MARRGIRLPGVGDVPTVQVARDPGVRVPQTSSIGEGLQDIGAGLAGLSEDLQRELDRQQRLADATARTERRLEFNRAGMDEFVRLQREDDPSRPGFMRDYGDFLDRRMEEALASAPEDMSPEARELLRLDLLERRQAMIDNAGRVQIQAQHDRAVDSIDAQINEYTAQALRDPDFLDAYLDMAGDDLAAFEGALTPAAERTAKARARSAIIEASVEGFIQAGRYDDAAAVLADERFDEDLTLAKRQELRNALESARTRGAAAQRNEVNRLIADHLASIKTTGVGMAGLPERAAVVLDAEASAEFQERERIAQAYYATFQGVRFATPEEGLALIEAQRPAPGSEGFAAQQKLYETLRAGFAQMLERRASDPALYAMEVPEVARAFEAVQDDPARLEGALAARVDTQREMGIQAPRVLSLPEAQSVVAELLRRPGHERAAEIRRLREGYGRFANRAFGELVDAGLDARTAVLASVADDPVLAQQLGQVLDTSSQALREGLPRGVATDIEEAVTDSLADFTAAFQAGDFTGASVAQVNGIRSAVTDLAILLYRQTGDAAAAAETAADRIINDRFTILDTDRIQAFVPDTLDGQAINAAKVEAAAERMQTREALEALDIMPIDDPGAEEFVTVERTLRTAVNSGFWVTNDTGTGLVLMIPFMGGGALPLLTRSGERIEIDFIEATNAPGPALVDTPIGPMRLPQ